MLRMKRAIVRWMERAGYRPERYPPPDIGDDILAIFDRVDDYTMTPLLRVNALCEAVDVLVENRTPGALVECGVWRGGSMMAAALRLLHHHDTSRDLYLYDTFEGMSAPTSDDVRRNGTTAAADYQARITACGHSGWAVATLDDVREAIYSTGYPPERIHLVKGPVEETIPATMADQIALLRLDTDWYGSTLHELVHLYPRIVRGGVLIVDDYGEWQGCRKAVDEYLERLDSRPLLHRVDHAARAAVIT